MKRRVWIEVLVLLGVLVGAATLGSTLLSTENSPPPTSPTPAHGSTQGSKESPPPPTSSTSAHRSTQVSKGPAPPREPRRFSLGGITLGMPQQEARECEILGHSSWVSGLTAGLVSDAIGSMLCQDGKSLLDMEGSGCTTESVFKALGLPDATYLEKVPATGGLHRGDRYHFLYFRDRLDVMFGRLPRPAVLFPDANKSCWSFRLTTHDLQLERGRGKPDVRF